ncbi:3-oxoacyl-ACP reductase [Comamonas serinivorans]|uniref:3-oxoacyl-ACP reductase n=1 Tax=Comamonas serinivorans TaxID=1082851 RepID=A0A1Y0ET96_9BURK|nr:3-oxoacyl-ACP reductase [Comamonas serinivorans]
MVTGAGAGIGRASAVALSQAGWQVYLLGRREAPLAETQALCVPGSARVVVADVSQPDQVQTAFARIRAEAGRLDLLFNNAGRGAPGVPLEELDLAVWRQVVDVNLNGMFYCLQAAFQLMKAQSPQGGRIINNGSISATAPRPNSIAYTATKHAVSGLTKAASLDGRKHGIAVGQIDVGNAATEMTERMAAGILQANGQLMEEPRMSVDDVARSVVYMASLPLSANVLFHTIMATNMPFVGRG